MSIKNTAIAAFAFIIIYNLIFFQSGFGIGIGFFFLVLNIYFFFSRNDSGKNLNFGLFSSGLSILFAFLFSYRANLIVQVTDFLAAGFFSLVALYFYKYQGEISFKTLSFLWIPFLVVEKSLGSLLRLLRNEETAVGTDKKETYSALIRGLIITIPIFIVLLLLLTAADPIFRKVTQNLFQNVGERIVISGLLFITIMGLGLAKFLEKTTQKQEINIGKGKSQELAVFTGSIIFLFAVFIAVQFRYLFFSVGERELQQLGITSLTYSEYVRKGFFELLIAAFLSSGIILYIFRYLHHLKESQKQLLQLFSAVLTIETGLLLLSAVKRLALYADAHGLTRARVFGFIFLLWLTVILLIFLIRVFRELKEKEFFAGTTLATLMLLTLINIVNVDGVIADQYKPTVNKEIDYYYLSNLSTDAGRAWKESLADAEQLVNQLEAVPNLTAEDNRKLYWRTTTLANLNSQAAKLIAKYGSLEELKTWYKDSQSAEAEKIRLAKTEADLPANIRSAKKWQRFNFSEYAAYKMLSDNFTYFLKIPALSGRMSILSSRVSYEVRRDTFLDRSTDPPLLP